MSRLVERFYVPTIGESHAWREVAWDSLNNGTQREQTLAGALLTLIDAYEHARTASDEPMVVEP